VTIEHNFRKTLGTNPWVAMWETKRRREFSSIGFGAHFARLTVFRRGGIVCVRTIGTEAAHEPVMNTPRGGWATRTDRGEPYLLEQQAGHLLRRAHQRHTAIFQEIQGDSQLTPLQFAALVKLRDLGEVSQNQLGRLIAMDAATMQGVIKRLDGRGLIARRADPDDRRRLVLSLSASGRRLIDSAIEAGREITRLTLEPLTAAERKTFTALLMRLAE